MAGRLAYYINYAYLLVLGPWALQKSKAPTRLGAENGSCGGSILFCPKATKIPPPRQAEARRRGDWASGPLLCLQQAAAACCCLPTAMSLPPRLVGPTRERVEPPLPLSFSNLRRDEVAHVGEIVHDVVPMTGPRPAPTLLACGPDLDEVVHDKAQGRTAARANLAGV